MTSFDHLDPSSPVVVGAAELVHRPGSEFAPCSATDLLLEVTAMALASSGAGEALGRRVGEVLVPHGTWTETDPGRAIAEAIGAPAARSVRSELGVLQHTLLARAITTVMTGGVDVAVVAGAENRWSGVAAAKDGVTIPGAPQAALGEPDEILVSSDMVVSPIEIERNLTTAAHQYAIIESALRHRLGRGVEEHQRALGELWASFARVAADAPAGWDQRSLDADEISRPSESNRMIASPYPKWLISQWNVDQGAALVITTVGLARELGIAEDRCVFPLSMAMSNLVVPMPERADISSWPASRVCGEVALASAGLAPSDIDLVDLYSCFPSAVEVQAAELGLGLERQLTLTGGMTFGGGPFNNYSLQGAAAMVRALRDEEGPATGLTSAVSGLLTKNSVALWSTKPPTAPFVAHEVADRARAETPTRRVDPDLVGPATVVGATVVPDRSGALVTIVVVESAAGVRSVAQCGDDAVGARFLRTDPVGVEVVLGEPGRFTLG